jgi:Glycosyl transferase family 2
MKVAIVTPYHGENWETILAAHESVRLQTVRETEHFLIGDGQIEDYLDDWVCVHYKLPVCHDDAGGTPRAIGAMSAFAQGYDAVGFLDADCTLELTHVEIMLDMLRKTNAAAVIATRTIQNRTGETMYVDEIESNGDNMVDTNCWFITKKIMPYLHEWIVEPDERLFNDRIFGAAVGGSGLDIARCGIPTVNYRTKFAWHYQYAGWAIPDDAVWIERDAAGKLYHKPHIIK